MGLGTPGLVPLLDEEILPPPKTEEPVSAQAGPAADPPPLGDSGIVTSIKTIDPRQTVDNQAEWPDPVGTVQLGWDFEVVSRTPTMLSIWNGLDTGPTGAVQSGTGTVVAIELSPVNYVSVNTGALTIDQTDPTNILFSASPGSQLGTGDITGLFGSGKSIWVTCTNLSGSGDLNLINGTVNSTHPYITYTTGGHFDFVKAGSYSYSINGSVAVPGSPTGSNRATIKFTNNSGSILEGLPSQMRQSVYLGGQDHTGETGVDVTGTVTVYATIGTRLTPTVASSWNGVWTNVDCTITSIFGPGSLGTIEYLVTPQYAYCTWEQAEDGVRPNSIGITAAPNDVGNGQIPPHSLTATAYYGDADNPLWYPNGPMYIGATISPFPNALLENVTLEVLEWDSGPPPDDIIVLPQNFDAGVGVACQGLHVWLPHSGSGPDYADTSFIVRATFDDIESVFDLYFKQCDTGENGATHTTAGYNIQQSLSDTTSEYLYLYDSETNGNRNIVPSDVTDSSDQLIKDKYWTLISTNIWGDPRDVSWTVEFKGVLFTLWYYTGASPYDPFLMDADTFATFMDTYNGTSYGSGSAMRAALGINDPTITFLDQGDMLTMDPKRFAITPWGQWRVRFPTSSTYDIYVENSPDGMGGSQYAAENFPTVWTFQAYWQGNPTAFLTQHAVSPALPNTLIYP